MSTWTRKSMSVNYHSDSDKCKKVEKITNSRYRASEMEKLADSGNIDACVDYGLMLMKGIWDEYEMGLDLVRGQLEPVNPEIKKDKYLIVPRDPVRAMEYFKMAASYPFDNDTGYFVRDRAECILAHCQRNGLAGFKRGDPVTYDLPKSVGSDSNDISHYVDILNSCGKSATAQSGDLEAGEFVPLPDVRPTARDPYREVFRKNGELTSEASAYMAVYGMIGALGVYAFFSIIFLIGGGSFDFVQFSHVLIGLCVFIAIPQLTFSYIFMKLGEEKTLPVCDCKHIREAYKECIKSLPAEYAPKKDPFQETSFFIRKLEYFRFWLIWSYMFAFVLQIILLISYEPFKDFMTSKMISDKYYIITWFFPALLALISSFMLLIEIDASDSGDDDFVCSLFKTFFFWSYNHNGCKLFLEDYKKE